jgi:hypothetical protein
MVAIADMAKHYSAHKNNHSVRIYNMELLGAVDDLKEYYAERNQVMITAFEIQEKLQALISNVAELAVRLQTKFFCKIFYLLRFVLFYFIKIGDVQIRIPT